MGTRMCKCAHSPFFFPVGGQAAAPPPEGAPGICESTPITSPQLEAMNQLVTLLFYPGRITLTTSLRKFRGVCPLRWTEGHTCGHKRRRGEFSGRALVAAAAATTVSGVSRGPCIQCCSLFLDRDNGRRAHTSRRAAVWRQLS